MKSKRIIIIFSILLFLSLAVVLSSILFKIDSVEVVYASDPVLNVEKSDVESSLAQYKGTSIFFLNAKKIANKLESEVANLKVIKIDRLFPKKIRITVQERIEVYCFQIGEDYVYTDYNCKVLRIEDSKREIYDSKYGQTVDIKADEELISGYRKGEILEFFNYGATKFLAELYLKTTDDSIFLRKYIKSVDINHFYDRDYYIDNKLFSGSIVDIEMRTGAKFTFYKTSEHGEKYIAYMNRLMENDETTGVQIDRISGVYKINYLNGQYEFISED